jgi:hypothetical protein
VELPIVNFREDEVFSQGLGKRQTFSTVFSKAHWKVLGEVLFLNRPQRTIWSLSQDNCLFKKINNFQRTMIESSLYSVLIIMSMKIQNYLT